MGAGTAHTEAQGAKGQGTFKEPKECRCGGCTERKRDELRIKMWTDTKSFRMSWDILRILIIIVSAVDSEK